MGRRHGSPTSFLDTVKNLAPLDLFGLGLILVLVALGLWRGLWWQVIRLVGLVCAVALARVFSPETATWISESWPDLQPRLAHGIAWAAVFLLTLGAASILGLLGQKLLEAMQLGLANRVGGALIGAATGLIIHVSALVFVCQLAPESFVAKHVPGTYSERLLESAGSQWRVVLGADARDEVQRVFQASPSRALPEEPSEPDARTPATGQVR